MDIRLFEIRDRGTCMAVMAIRLEARNDRECALLSHAGYGRDPENHRGYILLMDLDSGEGTYTSDQYSRNYRGSRTLPVAHGYLYEFWDSLKSGDIVDVEFILRESTTPKTTDLGAY